MLYVRRTFGGGRGGLTFVFRATLSFHHYSPRPKGFADTAFLQDPFVTGLRLSNDFDIVVGHIG